MRIVGLSTGCFHHWNADVYEKIDRVLESRAETLEVNICDLKDFISLDPSKISPEIDRMKVLSFHLPWKGVVYGCNKESELVAEKMRELLECFKIHSFTIHADIIEDFDLFEEFELVVENLGKQDKFGSTVHDIEQIKKIYSPNFLLDIAHAYQMDNSMKNVEHMVSVMGDNLKLIHVSGFKSGNNHAMVIGADNEQIIKEWSHRLHHFPAILEGQIPSPKELNADIELLKNLK